MVRGAERMVIAWLAWAAALADPSVATWTARDDRDGDGLVTVPAGTWVRSRCASGQAPRLVGDGLGVEGALTLFGAPDALHPGPLPARTRWALPPGCHLQVATPHLDPWAMARAEREGRAVDPWPGPERELHPPLHAEEAEVLRTAAPFWDPTAVQGPRSGTRERWAAPDGPPHLGWRSTGPTWRLPHDRRATLTVVPRDPAERAPLCVRVDDVATCRVPRWHDGDPLPMVFHLASGTEPADIAVHPPQAEVWVRMVSHRPPPGGPAPTARAVSPVPLERRTVPPHHGRQHTVLVRPHRPARAGDVRWTRDPVPLAQALDDEGRVQVYFPRPSRDCRVHLPGAPPRRGHAQAGIERFVPTGPLASAGDVRVEGCEAWIRHRVDTPGGDLRVARAMTAALGGEEITWDLDPRHGSELRVRAQGATPFVAVLQLDDAQGHIILSPDGAGDAGEVVLPLPAGVHRLSVRSERAVALTVQQAGASGPADEPTGREADPRARVERGLQRGQPALAYEASTWLEGSDGSFAAQTALDRHRALVLYGPDTWAAEVAPWFDQDLPGLTEALGATAPGDPLALARALGGRDAARPAWYLAALGGQVLDGHDRRKAVAAMADAGVEDPVLLPLSVGVDWIDIAAVQGVRRRGPQAWPPRAEAQERFALEDEAFAERWQREHTTDLLLDTLVRLPEPPDALQVRARRRTPDADATVRLDVVAADGRSLASLRVPTDGQIHGLADLDGWTASDDARYLRRHGGQGLQVQVARPGEPAPAQEAIAWKSDGGRVAFTVHGPTALRLDAVAEGASELTLEAAGRVRRATLGPGRTERLTLAVPEGTHRVHITTDGPVALRPRIAVERDRALGPRLTLQPAPVGPRDPASEARHSPLPRPAARPPLTAFVAASAGTEPRPLLVAEDDETAARLDASVGALARSERLPLWTEASLTVYRPLDGTLGDVLRAGIGVDARLVHRPWTVWVLLDHSLSQAAQAPTGPALRLRHRLRLSRAVGRSTQWVADLGLRTSLPLGAPDPAGPAVLWSPYLDDHPNVVEPSTELRLHPGRWTRLVAGTGLRSNAPLQDAHPVDAWSWTARADLAGPGWLTQAGVRGGQLLADAHRPVAAHSWELFLGPRGVAWLSRDLGVELGVQALWRPAEGLGAWVSTRMLLGRERGLRDARPSQTPMPQAQRWGFEALPPPETR